ncbi:MAG: CPBP family intramembrane glutamic endopeptidase [Candidatus Odinarchaeota archaeon]
MDDRSIVEIKDIGNKNLILFFVITYSFSWLFWLPSLLYSVLFSTQVVLYEIFKIIGTFGPFIAAFILTLVNEGKEGLKYLWKRGWHCKNQQFLVISIFLIPSIYLTSLVLVIFFEGMIPKTFLYWPNPIEIITQFALFFFLGGPFQEEFGWRGYALDRLQLRFNALTSSIILGMIWGIWHLPGFFIIGTNQENQLFFPFLFSTIILSVLFTWIYNNSNRSILATMIFHATINGSNYIFPLDKTTLGFWFYRVLLNLVVVYIVLKFGPKYLSNSHRKKKKPFIVKDLI